MDLDPDCGVNRHPGGPDLSPLLQAGARWSKLRPSLGSPPPATYRQDMVTELTDGNFKSTLDSASTPVLVDFSASWCQPCKALAPTIDKVADEYQGKMAVYKVDIDNAQETAASFGIMSVPTCIFFRDGKEVDRFTGNVDLRTVKGHVDRVLG